jgi:hypothetical protein
MCVRKERTDTASPRLIAQALGYAFGLSQLVQRRLSFAELGQHRPLFKPDVERSL